MNTDDMRTFLENWHLEPIMGPQLNLSSSGEDKLREKNNVSYL